MSDDKKTVTVHADGPEILKCIHDFVNNPQSGASAAEIMRAFNAASVDIKNTR